MKCKMHKKSCSKPKIYKGCCCDDHFTTKKSVFTVWISCVEHNPKVTLGIKLGSYFCLSLFFHWCVEK